VPIADASEVIDEYSVGSEDGKQEEEEEEGVEKPSPSTSASQYANADARRKRYPRPPPHRREHYDSIRERLKSTGGKIKAWVVEFREEHKHDPRPEDKYEDSYVRELYILYKKLKNMVATLKGQLDAERPAVAQVEWQTGGRGGRGERGSRAPISEHQCAQLLGRSGAECDSTREY
jgi:hypothetical protein